jgi:hypothetical protein
MTEAYTDHSTAHETPQTAAIHHIGEVARRASTQSEASPDTVSLGDLVQLSSGDLWNEFIAYGNPRKREEESDLRLARQQRQKRNFELLKSEIEPTIVYDFIREKTEKFITAHTGLPVMHDVRPPLPRQMMLANLRQLHEDKIKGAKQNRGAFLAKQEAHVKVATDLANMYPEIQFARALQHAFKDRNDPKYASYAADVVNAAGRTLGILARRHNEQVSVEETRDTDGV